MTSPSRALGAGDGLRRQVRRLAAADAGEVDGDGRPFDPGGHGTILRRRATPGEIGRAARLVLALAAATPAAAELLHSIPRRRTAAAPASPYRRTGQDQPQPRGALRVRQLLQPDPDRVMRHRQAPLQPVGRVLGVVLQRVVNRLVQLLLRGIRQEVRQLPDGDRAVRRQVDLSEPVVNDRRWLGRPSSTGRAGRTGSSRRPAAPAPCRRGRAPGPARPATGLTSRRRRASRCPRRSVGSTSFATLIMSLSERLVAGHAQRRLPFFTAGLAHPRPRRLHQRLHLGVGTDQSVGDPGVLAEAGVQLDARRRVFRLAAVFRHR